MKWTSVSARFGMRGGPGVQRRHRIDGIVMSRACAGIAMVVAVAAGVGGCAVARNGLGTHDSACFKSLPAAHDAVHAEGHFAGMRYTTLGDLETALARAPGGVAVASPDRLADVPRRTGVCVVSYHGLYHPGAVLDGWSPIGVHAGHIAIVIVRQSDLHVLATVVIEHEPLGFTRTFPRL
jgi:hypothetical protein